MPGAGALHGSGDATAVGSGRIGRAAAQAEFVDTSRPTRCAEEDNVDVRVTGKGIDSFRIVAQHPPYIASITDDSTAPDFTDCDMSGDPVHRFEPLTTVLYEDATLRVVGHRFATFWRPGSVDFRVGARRQPGLHLVQLVRRMPGRDVEMLVVYPSDGYWRAKPLPPTHLPDTAYGSSFLVGPVDDRGRPIVALRSIALDPTTLVFRLAFADGSRGSLAIAESTRERIALDVRLAPPAKAGRAFAALRSMYVRVDQADVSVADWVGPDGRRRVEPIPGFGRARTERIRFGRDLRSRHNLSAPDMVFEGFSTRR